eukprot:gene21638-1228_t
MAVNNSTSRSIMNMLCQPQLTIPTKSHPSRQLPLHSSENNHYNDSRLPDLLPSSHPCRTITISANIRHTDACAYCDRPAWLRRWQQVSDSLESSIIAAISPQRQWNNISQEATVALVAFTDSENICPFS